MPTDEAGALFRPNVAAFSERFGDRRMKYPEKFGALRSLLFAAAVLLPASVSAQEAAAPAEGEAPPPSTPWVKICANQGEGGSEICNISQVLLAPNGSVIASFSMQPMPDNKIAIGAFVPLGFVIPAGVGLVVDGEAKATAQFTICMPPTQDGPAGCAARADLGPEFVDALKKGNTLAIVVANQQGQAIPIEMTLVGFSKTYDGRGIDPVAARAMEVEQSRQLQEDARAAFQRMIERQQAESGTAN
jgi:invasion protein IalB